MAIHDQQPLSPGSPKFYQVLDSFAGKGGTCILLRYNVWNEVLGEILHPNRS